MNWEPLTPNIPLIKTGCREPTSRLELLTC
jgi:hypothetical protein